MMTTKSKTHGKASEAPLPEPTEADRIAIAKATEAQAKRAKRVRIRQEYDAATKTLRVGAPHRDQVGWRNHFYEAVGTRSAAFADEVLRWASEAALRKDEDFSEDAVNAAIAIIESVAPQDELEAVIASQIVNAHYASLDFTRRARVNAGEYVDTAATYAGMATKMSRTVLAAVETLAKLRSGGKQTHEVRYVYVNGPAVIGDHAQTIFGGGAPGGSEGKPGQPHEPLPCSEIAPGLPMLGQDPGWNAMPSTCDPRSQAVSAARRLEPRSAERKGERDV